MKQPLGKLRDETRGAVAVEYGLILALLVIATMGAVLGFADTAIGIWNDIAARVRGA